MSKNVVRRCLVPLLVGVAVLSGCSGEVSIGGSTDPGQEAVELIEGRLADEAGLGPLTAECEGTADIGAGDSFTCTGTTDDGGVIEFVGEVTEDGEGSVNSTNLATPGDIPNLASEAARILQQQNDLAELPPLACDDSRGLILAVDATLDCELTNPDNGETVPATITIVDPVDLTISVEVG